MKSLNILAYRSPILLHVGSCNICTNSKRKSRVNPPLKFYFPWKIFPNLYNPHRPPFSVPGSLMALLMFVLSAWVSWGVGSRRWGSSLSQVAKIRTDGEWKAQVERERENEVLPLSQSRDWVENLGRQIHLREVSKMKAGKAQSSKGQRSWTKSPKEWEP